MRVTKTEMWDKRDSSDWGESRKGEGRRERMLPSIIK